MPRLLSATLLCASLIAPLAFTPAALEAEEHRTVRNYHDKGHNDDHEWNERENRAYRVWAKENHRRYSNFARLRENDRQTYWGWRHEHSDALLNIRIR